MTWLTALEERMTAYIREVAGPGPYGEPEIRAAIRWAGQVAMEHAAVASERHAEQLRRDGHVGNQKDALTGPEKLRPAE